MSFGLHDYGKYRPSLCIRLTLKVTSEIESVSLSSLYERLNETRQGRVLLIIRNQCEYDHFKDSVFKPRYGLFYVSSNTVYIWFDEL